MGREEGENEVDFSGIKRHSIFSGWLCPSCLFKEVGLIDKPKRCHKHPFRNIDTALHELLFSAFSFTNCSQVLLLGNANVLDRLGPPDLSCFHLHSILAVKRPTSTGYLKCIPILRLLVESKPLGGPGRKLSSGEELGGGGGSGFHPLAHLGLWGGLVPQQLWLLSR